MLIILFGILSSFARAEEARLNWGDLDKLADYKCYVATDSSGVALNSAEKKFWIAEFIDLADPNADNVVEHKVVEFNAGACDGCFHVKLEISADMGDGQATILGYGEVDTKGKLAGTSAGLLNSFESVTMSLFDADGNPFQDEKPVTMECVQ